MIKEIRAKSLLSRNKSPEQWFGVNYGMNLYRGCQHGCIYCDSRSACYHIEDFDNTIEVKVNGPDLLEAALAKKRQTVTIGTGGMSDCYMPIERSYGLMEQCVALIETYKMRLHIATKSDLVLRDIDMIEKISKRYANVAISITTADQALAKVIEPYASSPEARFLAIQQLRERDIEAGILLMPQLPYLMEDRKHIDGLIEGAVKANVSFIVPAFGMTLREGNREFYYDKLKAYKPELVEKYKKRYGNQYGIGVVNHDKIEAYFRRLCKENNLELRMPMYREPDCGEQISLF